MTQKIIYFTAGSVVTVEEAADIEAINALCEPAYSLTVSNGSVPPNLGNDSEGDPILDACDFVAGSIPEEYSEIDEFDPDNPPGPDLPDTDAIVSDEDEIAVTNSAGAPIGDATLSVEDNEVTGAALPATIAAVSNGQELTIGEETFTFTVADGVITAIVVGEAD